MKYYFGTRACLCLDEEWKETLFGENQFKTMLPLLKNKKKHNRPRNKFQNGAVRKYTPAPVVPPTTF